MPLLLLIFARVSEREKKRRRTQTQTYFSLSQKPNAKRQHRKAHTAQLKLALLFGVRGMRNIKNQRGWLNQKKPTELNWDSGMGWGVRGWIEFAAD